MCNGCCPGICGTTCPFAGLATRPMNSHGRAAWMHDNGLFIISNHETLVLQSKHCVPSSRSARCSSLPSDFIYSWADLENGIECIYDSSWHLNVTSSFTIRQTAFQKHRKHVFVVLCFVSFAPFGYRFSCKVYRFERTITTWPYRSKANKNGSVWLFIQKVNLTITSTKGAKC